MRTKADIEIGMVALVTIDQLVSEYRLILQIKPIVNKALIDLLITFNWTYVKTGRESRPREHVLKICLLITIYSILNGLYFYERLNYYLLLKWLLDLNIVNPVFDVSTFSENKEVLLNNEMAKEFLLVVLEVVQGLKLLSEDNFTAYGIFHELWAAFKSLNSKEGGVNPAVDDKNLRVDFHVKKTELSFTDHVLMEAMGFSEISDNNRCSGPS